MLSAQHLEITFNPGTPIETRALRGMSLDIPAGQFVTVIGSNGAGKSTFLNAISGDQTVDSGRIAIDGVDVTRMPVWARAERVARVFQDPMAGTCEDLTIEENMALAQRRGTVRNLGRISQQLTLDGVLTKHPLTRGLAEVVTYLSLAANSDFAMIDDSHEEEISWSTAAGRVRKCRLPRVIFLKKAAAGGAVHE